MLSRRKRLYVTRVEPQEADEAPKRPAPFRRRLMCTAHPEWNRYPSLIPTHLADATERTHTIDFAHLVEMHDTISDLVTLLTEIKPRCVLFFATGGYPVVMPLLYRLYKAGQYDLVTGSVFHVFPGLSWDGRIDGLQSDAYLARELEPVLRAPSSHGGNAIVAIDTTNSGNAVNLAVKAIAAACEHAGIQNPDVCVIGIVNREKAAKADDGGRIFLATADDPAEGVYVLAPSGFTPEELVRSHRLTRFTSPVERLKEVRIGYWLVDKIFTEDVAELIGAEAVRESLGVKSAGGAGRLLIRFNDRARTYSTGYGSVAQRLIALLSRPRDSGPWNLLERNWEYAENQVQDEEVHRSARKTTETFFRKFELEHRPAVAADCLLKIKRLPNEDEIRWLTDHLPHTVAATPKVIAAMRKAKDTNLVEAALEFLRMGHIEVAASEPKGLDAEKARKWWIARWAERKRR
jgi:hypothetical protein